MSKYEELHELIVGDKTFDLTASECLGAKIALQWLDQNHDQVPGRTLTRSDMTEAFGEEYAGWATHRLARVGYTIVPDPEPTNLERLEALQDDWLRESRSGELFIEYLDRVGVKSPGGDDE